MTKPLAPAKARKKPKALRRGPDRRRQIIAAASELFARNGFEGTSIRDIGAASGVLSGSLYYHFPSKEDLLEEYLRIASIDTMHALQIVVDNQKAPKDKVLAVFDFLLQIIRQTEFNGCNFLNISSEIPQGTNKIRTLIKRQKNQVRSLFATILKPIGKEQLADDLYLLFDAALASSKVFGDAWPAKSAKKMAEKLI